MPNGYAQKFPELHDPEWLRKHYVDLGLSSIEIAELLGCSPGNVQLCMRKLGIKARGRHYGRWNPKACARCSEQFTPSGPAAKFCSEACRWGTAECKACGEMFVRRPTQGTKARKDNLYCSYTCRWADAKTRDEYGRYLNSEGYVVLDKRWSTKEPSRGLNDNGYVRLNLRKDGRVLEHRHVMEQKLGRPLLPDETVHHVNGVKTDNRPENLELWVSKHPRGQRVEDVIDWATEMLERYAADRLT